MKLAQKNVAIVPARAGSKRLPNKNVKIFNGKPLFQWTVDAAIESGIFEKVVLSTDCKEIARHEQVDDRVVKVLRPDELATDSAKQEDVIRHALELLGIQKSNICLLQPTSPLRTAADINESHRILIEKRCCIISASKICQKPAQWVIQKDHMHSGLELSTILEECFMPNGAIYWFPNINGRVDLSRNPSAVFAMDHNCSVDIDTAFDFELAQFMSRYKK